MAPRLIRLTLATALLALALTGPVTATSPSRTPTVATAAARTRVLVLGDSYSAGNGAGDYYGPAECRRSHGDYGHLFAALERAAGHPTQVDVGACSGAVTDSYWHAQHPDLAPQRSYVNRSYDLVMLTLGGNDASFSSLVASCLVLPSATGCDTALTSAEGMMPTIQQRLRAILTDIESRLSPNAKVVLLGYPYLESDTTLAVGDVQAGQRLRALQQDADTMESDLVAQLDAASANKPFDFVATSPLYEGDESWLPGADQVSHELDATADAAGTPNPDRWMVVPLIDAGVADLDTFYHPNPQGWAAEASLLVHDAGVPDAYGSGTGWTRVSVGRDAVCGVRSGTTWCWGAGHSDPRQVPAGTRPRGAGAATTTTCRVLADGVGECRGSNRYGQLGRAPALGTRKVVDHWVVVSGQHRWTRIVVGAHQACGIMRGGRLACWGTDRGGALGRAVTSGKRLVTSPAEVRLPVYDTATPQ